MIDRGKRSVLGIMVDAIDYEAALSRVLSAAAYHRSCTVSALAVHGIMTGVQNPVHKFRLNSFDLLLPDGQPVRWALNLVHRTNLADRVCGTELTLRILEALEREGLPVYFYGSTPEVLLQLAARLKQRFPALVIAGVEPSKFRTLGFSERFALADRITNSGAAITFVGLGCPRQEVFAFEMRELVSMPILAVGAAFPFIAGELARAPQLMQRNGLEWVFRLAEEPRRLWRRYLLLNPYYLLLLIGQIVGMRFSTTGSKPVSDVRYG